MGKTGNILITAFFSLIIVVFGCATLLNSSDDILKSVSKGSLTKVSDEIEGIMTESFYKRNNWIDVNGLFQRLIGVTVIRDAGDIDVFKMSNGQLTYDYPDVDMAEFSKSVTDLDRFVKSKGKQFIYVQLPCKAYSDELMPPGVHTYGYSCSDQLLGDLIEKDVDVLDLRAKIEEEGFDIPSLYFNTDHHWKPSTALWAAGVISDKLADTVDGYEYDPKIYDTDNFETKTYEDWFLGSLGRRTGRFFGGTDDFDVIKPTFSTDFSLATESQTSGKPGKRSGSFEDVFLKTSILDEKDYYNEMTYFTYMGTEYRSSIVDNRKADNDKKILMLRDSFSCTLLPFLALSANEITAIDLRYHSKIDIKDYIENNDFDIIMVAYNPSMFREEGAFDFDR